MIYTIVGTHTKLREKGNKELHALGDATHHIYSEQVSVLESLIDAGSLFGDTVIVYCLSLGELASSKEELLRHLDTMKNSSNIFIIDEPFADVHLVNKLTKVSEKIYDAREEKIKDNSIFDLADAFVARDKKRAWSLFMNKKDTESGESIQGILWWKFQGEWLRVKEGKRSLFTLPECEKIGGELLRSSILAHRGQRDLMVELEKIILSL